MKKGGATFGDQAVISVIIGIYLRNQLLHQTVAHIYHALDVDCMIFRHFARIMPLPYRDVCRRPAMILGQYHISAFLGGTVIGGLHRSSEGIAD